MTYSWLVENFTKEGQSTGLYMACQVNMTVTADANAARKFRRQRTAEFRALDMREARRGDWRAVEHGFDDTALGDEASRRLNAEREAARLRDLLHRMLEAPTTKISAGWKDAIRQAMSVAAPDSKAPEFECLGEPSLCTNPRGCACPEAKP